MKIKSLKYFALAMFAGVVMFTSCEKDPVVFDAPTIVFAETNSLVLDVTQGTSYELEINITVTAPGTIEEFTVERSKLLSSTEVGSPFSFQISDFSGKTETTYKASDIVNYNEFINGTIDKIEYRVVVKDKQGVIRDAAFTVTMGAFTKLTTEVTIGELWKIQSAGNGSWNLKSDEKITSIGNDNAENRYMINATIEDTPGDVGTNFTGSWSSFEVSWYRPSISNTEVTKGNGTKFVKANTFNYTTAVKEVALSVFEAAGDAGQLTTIDAPAANDIYIGVLGTEVYVIKITEIDKAAVPPTGAKLNSGVMRFSYKK